MLNAGHITVSGAQSIGIDIQDATYAWTLESGQAEILNPNNLETEVLFAQSNAGQTVTLKLRVSSGGQEAEQSISIEHRIGAG